MTGLACLFVNLFGRDLEENLRPKGALWCQRMLFILVIVAFMVLVPLAFMPLAFSWHRLLVVCILPISVNPESAESLATRPARVTTTPTTSEYVEPDLVVIPYRSLEDFDCPLYHCHLTALLYKSRLLRSTCSASNMSSTVTIDYNALKSDPASLEADFKAAFGNGNDALGAIIIKGQSR